MIDISFNITIYIIVRLSKILYGIQRFLLTYFRAVLPKAKPPTPRVLMLRVSDVHEMRIVLVQENLDQLLRRLP